MRAEPFWHPTVCRVFRSPFLDRAGYLYSRTAEKVCFLGSSPDCKDMNTPWSQVRLLKYLTLPFSQAHAAGVVERARQYTHEDYQDHQLDEQDLRLFHALDPFEVGGEQ
jgi:hypothetical protein